MRAAVSLKILIHRLDAVGQVAVEIAVHAALPILLIVLPKVFHIFLVEQFLLGQLVDHRIGFGFRWRKHTHVLEVWDTRSGTIERCELAPWCGRQRKRRFSGMLLLQDKGKYHCGPNDQTHKRECKGTRACRR